MATSNLELLIEAFVKGLEDVQALGESIKDLGGKSAEAEIASSGLASGLDKLATDMEKSNSITGKISEGVATLKEGYEKVSEAVKHAAEAFLTYLGIEGIKQLADEAANAERLALAFEKVGTNAGIASDALESYAGSLVAIGFTAEQAEKSLTKLITTGVDLTKTNEEGISTAIQLGQLAQNLAATTGRSEAEALDLLTFSIARQNDRMLRQIGLRVDLKTAEENYASAVGETVAELTNEQKAQAFTNELLQQGQKFQGAYAAFLDTVAGKISTLSTEQDKLRVAIGEQLLPAYKTLIDATTESVRHFEELVTKATSTGEVAELLGRTFKSIADGISEFVDRTLDFFASLFPEVAQLGESLGNLLGVILKFGAAIIEVLTDTGEFKAILLLLVGAVEAVIIVVSSFYQAFLETVAAVDKAAAAYARFQALVAASQGNFAYAKQLNDQADALDKLGDKYFALSDKAGAALDKMVSSTAGIADEANKTKTAFDSISTAITSGFLQSLSEVDKQFQGNQISAEEARAKINLLRLEIIALGSVGIISAANIETLKNVVGKGFSDIEKAATDAKGKLKLSDGEISKGYNDEFEVIGRTMTKFLGSAKLTAEGIANAFTVKAESFTSINELVAAFNALTPAIKRSLDQAGLLQPVIQETSKRFTELFSTSLAAAKTEADIKNIGNSLEFMRDAIPDSEFNAFFDALVDKATELNIALQNPALAASLKVLGLTALEASTNITTGFKEATNALFVVADQAGITSLAMKAAFGADIVKAKTIQDIGLVVDGLAKVKINSDADKAAVEDFKNKTNEALDAIVDKLIKAAKTKQDFSDILTYLSSLKNVDLTTLQTEMDKVRIAAAGAAADVQKLSEASLALSNEQLKVDQADIAIKAAKSTLQKDEIALKKASYDLSLEDTQANRAAFELASAQVQVDKAEVKLAQDKLDVEQKQLDVLRETNDLAALVAKQSVDPSSALAAQIQAAQEKLKADQASLNVSKEQVNEDQADLDKLKEQTQEIKDRADAMDKGARGSSDNFQKLRQVVQSIPDGMRDVAIESDKSVTSAQQFDLEWSSAGDSVRGVGFNIGTITSQMTALGVSSQDAAKWAAQFNQEWTDVLNRQVGKSGLQAWYDTLNAAAKITDEINKQAADLKLVNDELNKYVAGMNAVFATAEDVAEAIVDGDTGIKQMGTGATVLVNAMRQFAEQAKQAADSAKSSALGFLDSVASIREQVLQAQGKYVEAAELQYDVQKRDLAIQERLLEIEIQKAIIEAKAAGLNDAVKDLQGYLKEVQDGYKQAVLDINTLEDTAVDAARKQEQAALEAAKSMQDANSQTSYELLAQIANANQAAADPSYGVSGSTIPATQSGASVSAAQNAANAALFGLAVQENASGTNNKNNLYTPPAIPHTDTSVSAGSSVVLNITLDGSDLLSEDQIRRKVVPVLDKIFQRSD